MGQVSAGEGIAWEVGLNNRLLLAREGGCRRGIASRCLLLAFGSGVGLGAASSCLLLALMGVVLGGSSVADAWGKCGVCGDSEVGELLIERLDVSPFLR